MKEKEYSGSDSPRPKELPRLPRNDIPNRFWSTIEPYCSEITNEDLKVLEDIIRSHEDDADYQKVTEELLEQHLKYNFKFLVFNILRKLFYNNSHISICPYFTFL